MAKPKEKSKKLKRLYKQLSRAITMNLTRPRIKVLNKYGDSLTQMIPTQRGRIEHAIQTLEGGRQMKWRYRILWWVITGISAVLITDGIFYAFYLRQEEYPVLWWSIDLTIVLISTIVLAIIENKYESK